MTAEPPVPYDINYADSLGNTALHYACESMAVNVLGALLEEEVDMDLQNRLDGDTPLHITCRLDNEEVRNWILQELLDAGASTTIKNRAGLRPADLINGDKAARPLGQEALQLLSVSQAQSHIGADDIAYGEFACLTV